MTTKQAERVTQIAPLVELEVLMKWVDVKESLKSHLMTYTTAFMPLSKAFQFIKLGLCTPVVSNDAKWMYRQKGHTTRFMSNPFVMNSEGVFEEVSD